MIYDTKTSLKSMILGFRLGGVGPTTQKIKKNNEENIKENVKFRLGGVGPTIHKINKKIIMKKTLKRVELKINMLGAFLIHPST